MRHVVAFIFILVTAVTSRWAHADVQRPVYGRRLASGLQLIVCPDPGSADVSVLVHYNVGARDEPGGARGARAPRGAHDVHRVEAPRARRD